ncbi:MAG: DNA-directed RNA polymerase subunit omega [Clostridia bacterium]|nr:DNA-directed RNA polymerase subunit omega [Clostridia bacterium]
MINEPPVDLLTDKLGEKYNGSKYALCVVAAKRARQLVDVAKNQNNPAILDSKKPLTAAAYEIVDGKVSVVNG